MTIREIARAFREKNRRKFSINLITVYSTVTTLKSHFDFSTKTEPRFLPKRNKTKCTKSRTVETDSIYIHSFASNRAEKRLRMRAVDSFWRFFDRFTPLNNVVLAGDFLAITTFDNMHERMETWRGKASTTL